MLEQALIQQMAERMKEAIRESRPIETAQIQIVGLEAVKQSAGAQWGQLSGRVRETSMDFIRQRVGPNDVVIPAGDGFLVIYAEPEDFSGKRSALQEELNGFYMGEEFTRDLSVNVKTENLGAELLFERMAKPQPTPFWESAGPVSPAELPLVILPVWSISQEALTGYWVAPEQVGRAIGRFAYDPVWSETGWHRDDKDFLELDLRIVNQAVAEIQDCLKRGKRCLVGFSVHSTTLLNRNRRRTYMQAVSAAPAEVRPFLNARIAELQAGTPMSAVAEWVHQLRQISHRLDIEIHHSQMDVMGMEGMGLTGLACVMPTSHPSPAEVTVLTRNIIVWARDLKRQSLKLRLDNVEDPRLLGLCLDQQIDCCSSARLWPVVPEAEGVKPYSREQFLKALPATAAERRTA